MLADPKHPADNGGSTNESILRVSSLHLVLIRGDFLTKLKLFQSPWI